MAAYRMTPARRAALRKAQLASARKRKKVTVYHYTSPRKAAKIVKQQQFKTHSGIRGPGNVKNHVYGTRRRSRFYENEFRRKKAVAVKFKVPAHAVQRDKNDVWFKERVEMFGSKHKPANAYMVDKAHLKGAKISHVKSAGTKKKTASKRKVKR